MKGNLKDYAAWTLLCWVIIVALVGVLTFVYYQGYDIGWDEGYEAGVQVFPPGEELMPGIDWYEEPEESNWEVLSNVFEEIDTANITIHLADADGSKVDIHIFWDK